MKSQTQQGASIAKPPIAKIYGIQLLVLLIAAAGLLLVNTTSAYSALLGGLISIVPNVYFAITAYRFSGARSAQRVAHSMYRGEVIKFVLSAAGFASVFVLVKPIAAGLLFTAFILTMVLNTLLIFRLGLRA